MVNEKAFKDIIDNYSKLETKMLEEIVKHFKLNDEFINSDYFRLEKLEELGLLNDNIIKYIAEVTKQTPEQIKKAMKAIGFESLNINELNNAYNGGYLQIAPSILIEKQIVQNLIEHAYNELENRFLSISNKIENSVRQAYLDVVEKVYLQTTSGMTYQEAVRNALVDLGNQGITTLTYKTVDSNGKVVGLRNYDIEGAVRREVITANSKLVNEINKSVAEELEVEYVILSEHIDCRPQHFPWQGTIIKRTDIEIVTGYGNVDGMGGPNCKHYPKPYFGTARGSELKSITFEKATEQYELTQKQRYLERNIRKWKRKARVFKTAEDKEYYEKCKNKVKKWQLRNKKFTETNNLRRDFSRENVEKIKNGGIISKKVEKEENRLQYIGKLDKEKLGKYRDKVVTDEVVLTDERIEHIKEHHPGDFENYGKYVSDIIEDPEYVVNDSKNIDTVLFMKTIKDNERNIQVVVKLNTNETLKDKQNSILTLWKIKDKAYRQILRNKEILWKKLDKKE